MPWENGKHIPAQMKKCIFCGRRTPIGTKCCTGRFLVLHRTVSVNPMHRGMRRNPHVNLFCKRYRSIAARQYALSLQLARVERVEKNR